MSSIKNNLKMVLQRIDDAAARSGRKPDDVTLIAVSKVHPASAIVEAFEAGQRHFGENYAQELMDKHTALMTECQDIRWHFIGHLQRNKAKAVVTTGALVETVDSVRLAEELNRQADLRGLSLPILLQVNVGEEPQKSGIPSEALPALMDAVEGLAHISLEGLMTIPPWDLDREETRKHFAALRRLREKNGGASRLPHLSMGMSHDFDVAVEEGATLVRVGTAIFGSRPVRRY